MANWILKRYAKYKPSPHYFVFLWHYLIVFYRLGGGRDGTWSFTSLRSTSRAQQMIRPHSRCSGHHSTGVLTDWFLPPITTELFFIQRKHCVRCGMAVVLQSLRHVRLLQPHGLGTYQTPPSMGFSRQEHWSGLPSPSPGHLSHPGIEHRSPALQADSLPTELQGKLRMWYASVNKENMGSFFGAQEDTIRNISANIS